MITLCIIVGCITAFCIAVLALSLCRISKQYDQDLNEQMAAIARDLRKYMA